MLTMMQTTINRNLLKYAAGHAIFCPHCNTVADYRRYALVDDDSGNIVWQGCTECLPDTFANVGYTIIRETPPKARKAPRLPDTVAVRSIGGGKLETVSAIKAFEMYGDAFFAHPSVTRSGYWVVTHALTGAAACTLEKSKAAAIRVARGNLERAGADGFEKAKGYAMQSKGNK